MNKTLLTAIALFIALSTTAQTGGIRGVILDEVDGSPLTGGTASILYQADTTYRRSTNTGLDGDFLLDGLRPGRYLLKLSYLSYTTSTRLITVDTGILNIDTVLLQPAENTIGTVTVTGSAIQARTLGDTLEFDARAFKTNPDATAEDLIGKMPGFTNDGTGLKVNGESVQRVLVDGKPFFGDDASAALKNLPAEVIGKIQVSDRKSDQARFTGFDDGNLEKTINIVTRDGKNQGFFGKVQGGYGGGTVPSDATTPGAPDEVEFDPRYTVSATVNHFKGPRRITILGLSNNVNQQNFSIDDIVGAMSSNSSAGGGAGGRGGGRGGDGFGGRGNSTSGGGGGNFGNIGNLFTGQQSGIATTNSIGLNYTDQWGTKVGVTGSYFFNRSTTTANTELQRRYITGVTDSSGGLIYDEVNRNVSTNANHRANLRIEYTIDSSNELIISPRVSFQDNSTSRDLDGVTRLAESITTSRIQNQYDNTSLGLNLNNELTYRHRFAKRGRTVSIGVTTGYNTRNGDGTIYSFSQSPAGDSTTDQQFDNESKGLNLSSNISYTEPAGRRGQVLLTYQPQHNRNNADRYAYDRPEGTSDYTNLNQTLSNVFDNQYTVHRGGGGYRFVDSLMEFGVTLNAQYARLTGEQTFPDAQTVDNPFFNVLPQLQFNYKFSRFENLRVNYRTNTNTPSITQLQSVVDNSNPLLLRTGNVDLRQDYTHNLFGRYSRTNIASGVSIFGFASASYIQDYIGNSTITALRDTTVGTIFLARGTQLSQPVNLDGAANARAFLTYSRPIKTIKSNTSLNTGLTYNRTPALINGLENLASNYGLNGGLTLSSNVSENLDFTASLQSTYTVVRNSLQTTVNNDYYNQIATLRLNYIFLKGVVFNTTVSHNLYSGLGEGFNQDFLLWNASLGYKFLKSKALQADIFVFDILKQNNAISRTINDSYTEDSRTDVLQRYGMLRLTYTLRRFQGKTVAEPQNQQVPPMIRMMQGGGMPPGMMGGPGPGG